ncbi:MAG: PfkB family carbohydrate kinase, partial [Longimicrobiales bacterium]|nr:PfkB family carbohydrate kinase [Longimicrobiales bacterium]
MLFDHLPEGPPVLGGAPFNVAWHLQGMGSQPILVSAVGDDDDGRRVLREMEEWGLGTEGVQTRSGHPTGRVEVTLDTEGPTFRIPPDQAWDHPEAAAAARALRGQPVGLVYHGTLALRSADARAALSAALHQTEAPVFIDVNLRDPWWSVAAVDEAVATATWVKLNRDELARLGGMPTGTAEACRAAAHAWARRRGIPNLIVTLGAEGALWLTEDGSVFTAAAPEVPVVDTVGAGDALSAVLCLGILEGWRPDVSLARATALAADVCRQRGAISGDLTLYERHTRRWARHGQGFDTGPRATPGLYVLSLSIHGLLRGRDIELGRDPDTGGQIGYVVDQARALAAHPAVERVVLVTRLVEDRRVDASYAEPEEVLVPGARIVRIPFGPRRYLRKERLWPHLDSLLDRLLRRIRGEGRVPDVIVGHYADAGYVGAQLGKLLGVPFVFTGHSLGRVKRERLLAAGQDEEALERRFNLSRRIEAEEQALEAAALVTASTRQEVDDQYQGYDHYQPGRMEVIPPGVDLERFSPPPLGWRNPPIRKVLRRFLRDPDRPMVLALARPDPRKNFSRLVQAYGETPELRDTANLVLIAGNREDIAEMPREARRVLTGILHLVDRYDLYGRVAYPKHHASEEVPDLYRLAARSRGVFVNPALTEPFGLTLLEAAASGLPLVATDDGGPRDILEACGNGVLVDPLDPAGMGEAILGVLRDRKQWGRYAKSGVRNVHRAFSWEAHARRWVDEVERVLAGARPALAPLTQNRIRDVDRMLVTDVDGTLVGDDEGTAALVEAVWEARPGVGFGLATGRSLDRALEVLREKGVPD